MNANESLEESKNELTYEQLVEQELYPYCLECGSPEKLQWYFNGEFLWNGGTLTLMTTMARCDCVDCHTNFEETFSKPFHTSIHIMSTDGYFKPTND